MRRGRVILDLEIEMNAREWLGTQLGSNVSPIGDENKYLVTNHVLNFSEPLKSFISRLLDSAVFQLSLWWLIRQCLFISLSRTKSRWRRVSTIILSLLYTPFCCGWHSISREIKFSGELIIIIITKISPYFSPNSGICLDQPFVYRFDAPNFRI